VRALFTSCCVNKSAGAPVQNEAEIAASHAFHQGPGFTDATDTVRLFVEHSGIRSGLLTVSVPHTSASLVIQENADPDVLRDLADAFARLALATATTGTRPKGPTTCRPTFAPR
jgi:thiamine phosphate synthase YjbQ (UPF0047 family)